MQLHPVHQAGYEPGCTYFRSTQCGSRRYAQCWYRFDARYLLPTGLTRGQLLLTSDRPLTYNFASNNNNTHTNIAQLI